MNTLELKSSKYIETINNYRQKNFKSANGTIYLDYLSQSLFTDSQIDNFKFDLGTNLYGNPHSESPSSELSTSRLEYMRKFLVNYFGIKNLTEYVVVYTNSHNAALKVIAEAFPFNEKSKFIYSSSSTNNILGLRGFAVEKGAKVNCVNLSTDKIKDFQPNSNNMIMFPLVDEFDGSVLSKEKIQEILNSAQGDHYTATVADVSAYVPFHKIDLKELHFSAIAISFGRMFGFPNIGCALIHASLIQKLQKPYFGGGTLVYALTASSFEKLRLKPSERFEDGSLPFLSIAGLINGFNQMEEVGFDDITSHVTNLGKKLKEEITNIRYESGSPAIVVYGQNTESVTTFNIIDKNGKVMDWRPFVEKAVEDGIIVSGGCGNTPGTCMSDLGIKPNEINSDVGAIRVSVGWASTEDDIEKFVAFVRKRLIQ